MLLTIYYHIGLSGVGPLIFTSLFCQFSIRLQTMAILKEGDQLQMWEFIRV